MLVVAVEVVELLFTPPAAAAAAAAAAALELVRLEPRRELPREELRLDMMIYQCSSPHRKKSRVTR